MVLVDFVFGGDRHGVVGLAAAGPAGEAVEGGLEVGTRRHLGAHGGAFPPFGGEHAAPPVGGPDTLAAVVARGAFG